MASSVGRYPGHVRALVAPAARVGAASVRDSRLAISRRQCPVRLFQQSGHIGEQPGTELTVDEPVVE